jgi:hypothetical protein
MVNEKAFDVGIKGFFKMNLSILSLIFLLKAIQLRTQA